MTQVSKLYGTRLAVGLVSALAITNAVSCDGGDGDGGILDGLDPDTFCGECGSVAKGDLSVAGNARLDGFFAAVVQLRQASATVRASFDADVLALAEAYGIAEADVDASFVAEITAAIRADFEARASGGVRLEYAPPRCSANLQVAVQAQASCEASADCEVEVDPGMVSVECSGSCSGSCSGECSGDVSCTPPGGSVECDVGCEGTCELSAAASCEGTCRGECDGTCSATLEDGSCAGSCDGMCEGACELSGMAMCEGTCHGTCHASVTPPECTGSVTCNAQCMGMCEGGCQGDFEPPSASANCEATAECQAQASAQANASFECSPPSLEFVFEFDAGVDAGAQAEFLARLDLLKVRLASIMQGAVRLKALIDGEVNGEVVFEEPPVAQVTSEIQGLISAGFSGNLGIAPGRLPCVASAFSEAGSLLGQVGTEITGTVRAQADFVALVGDLAG